MRILLIGYDLNKQGQDYPELWETIKESGTWWHNLDSTWLVKSALTAEGMRDRLMQHIDSNDELLVIDVTGAPAAWTGFTGNARQWLKDNL